MTTSGYECVIESIKLFEEKLHLAVEGILPVDNLQSSFFLAQKSGYSLWHFIRLFSSTTGITPKAYISSRIFTECAKFLILPKEDKNFRSISFIANIFGFESASNFSIAFRSWSGYTPAAVRKNASLDILSDAIKEPLVLPSKNVCKSISDERLHAEIIECKERHITGIAFYLDKPLLSFDKLWKSFSSKVKKINADKKADDNFIQYTAWNPSENGGNNDGEMLVICALETESGVAQSPIFINRIIPSGRFLHVVHTGSMNAIGKTYQKIYGEYFADSNLKLTSGWEYQMYRGDITDIFIPLF